LPPVSIDRDPAIIAEGVIAGNAGRGNIDPPPLVWYECSAIMPDTRARRRRNIGLILLGAVAALAVVIIAGAALAFSRYVKGEDADATTAASEFQAARDRFAGQVPLVEYRGIQSAIHRDRSRSRQQLHALRGLVYDAKDEYLQRLDMPFAVLKAATLSGHVELADAGIYGDDRDRITIEDLERHGPGLVIDTGGSAVLPLAFADAVIGTHSKDTQILLWTD
jgi:hypothetical protein